MKKIIWLAAGIMITVTVTESKAQTSYLSLGPVGSFGHSWTNNMGAGDGYFKPSPALGIGMMFSMREHWGFGTQLLVSHEGYAHEARLNGFMYDRMVNPVYLRMPMTVNYFFGRYGNVVRPRLYLGPSLGLKIDEQEDADLMGADVSYHASDEFRTFDVGIQGGAGVNIRMYRKTWLNLDAGYYQGLLDVSDRRGESDYNTNSNLRLNVGVLFGL